MVTDRDAALSLAESYDGVIPSDTGRAGAAFRVSFTMNLAIFLPGKPFRVNVSNFVPGGIPGDVKENIWTKFRQKKIFSKLCVVSGVLSRCSIIPCM